MVDSRVWRLSEAAREYDSRLMVGRNEDNGTWSVFIMRARDKPYPVLHLGFHMDELPTPEELRVRLYNADTRRHGTKILEDLNRHNDNMKLEVELRAQEADAILAEAQVWAHRRLSNNVNRVIKVFPGEKRRDRVTPEWK
jgi:hypothetical protein